MSFTSDINRSRIFADQTHNFTSKNITLCYTYFMTLLSPVRTTRPKTSNSHSYYSEILQKIKEEGLLKKTPFFYINRLIIITAITLAVWGGIIVGNIFLPFWGAVGLSAGLAIALGVLSAQYGFIAHEAAHKQVFQNHKTNEWTGRILANLLAGLSYGFWLRKHNRHHNKPNQINYDPDIDIRVLSFTPESLNKKKGIERKLSQNQGWLFPFLLFFTGFDLLLDSIVAIFQKNSPVSHRALEFSMMVVRQVFPFLAFWLITQNILVAAGLWVVMMLTTGFFLGIAFAPNHKGMPLVSEGAKIGYFERQVLTSRNIRSNWWTDNFMGGLNFQIEHHLFPSMSRPHLKRAHEIVTQFCVEKNIGFTETSMLGSFKIIIQYLNKVGLSNNVNPFNCPMVQTYKI